MSERYAFVVKLKKLLQFTITVYENGGKTWGRSFSTVFHFESCKHLHGDLVIARGGQTLA